MIFTETSIPGLVVIEPKIWKDGRGYFYESYNKKLFTDAGIREDFVQDNQSFSQKGALRGLHAQADPFAQGKLVRVIQGSVVEPAECVGEQLGALVHPAVGVGWCPRRHDQPSTTTFTQRPTPAISVTTVCPATR